MTDGVLLSRFKVGAWLVAEKKQTAFDGSREVDNPLQERTSVLVPLITLDVRVTERFGLQAAASVPDITRTAVVARPSGPFHYRENFSGLGDTSVLAWYRVQPWRRWNAVVNLGASIPTGRTERPRFRAELDNGSLVPLSRLQRGSGTVDPILGVTVDHPVTPLTVFLSAAARTPLYENDTGLRTGASWEVNGGAARELGTHRISGLARLGWLHRQQDAFEGTPVLVGGGHWLYFTPGVAMQAGKGITLQAEVKLPLYRRLANRQLDSHAVFQLGISRGF